MFNLPGIEPKKLRKPRKQLEQSFHNHLADILNKDLLEGSFWFPIPNGGSRSKKEASIMKGTGQVRAGVPDICVIIKGFVCFLELKTKTGVLNREQKKIIPLIEKAGCPVFICRTLKEAVDHLKRLGALPHDIFVADLPYV